MKKNEIQVFTLMPTLKCIDKLYEDAKNDNRLVINLLKRNDGFIGIHPLKESGYAPMFLFKDSESRDKAANDLDAYGYETSVFEQPIFIDKKYAKDI